MSFACERIAPIVGKKTVSVCMRNCVRKIPDRAGHVQVLLVNLMGVVMRGQIEHILALFNMEIAGGELVEVGEFLVRQANGKRKQQPLLFLVVPEREIKPIEC
jgi:hypothetical protein